MYYIYSHQLSLACAFQKSEIKPKAMFYLRSKPSFLSIPSFYSSHTYLFVVLQVTATDTSKGNSINCPKCVCSNLFLTVRSFKCTVQVNDDICAGSFVTGEKSGKNSTIVHFDETFLL